ncbi:HIT family hydrolase [Oenococcus oeni]|nr:HIT family hydrolase [Oenococcus oeni]KMQ40859.1 HIT family hydrolase [Oenococcus oeni]
MKKEHCIFCQRDAIKIVFENDLAVAFWDIHLVNKGHLLVIPKDHKEDFFDLSDDELLAIKELIFKGKELTDKNFKADGYNIGTNVGKYGGQTVRHCHFHLIPRYIGDDPKPAGGIRKILVKGQELI